MPADLKGWLANKATVDVQIGGPGNPWKLLDPSATLDGPSGVRSQKVESRYTRGNAAGQYKYLGAVKTANPDRIKVPLSLRLQACDFLQRLDCPVTLRARQACASRTTLTDYEQSIVYIDSHPDGGLDYSNPLANGTEDNGADVMEKINYSAGEEMRVVKVAHLDISGTISDFAINKIIGVGLRVCQSGCGVETTEENDFWAVTDRDSTPGYLTLPTPKFLWTTDGGTTWSTSDIAPFVNGDATDVAQYGAYVLVASPTHGVAYARYQDLVDGVANPWAHCTGFSGGTAFPKALAVVGGDVYAAGTLGYIWKSTDGFTFSVLSAGTVTTQTINDIAAAGCDLLWFAGNSGALVKLFKSALSLVVVKDSANATVTSNLNVVEVPDLRGYEVYVGTTGGKIIASKNADASTPTWAELAFSGAGTGSINDLKFGGTFGAILFIVQTEPGGSGRSRVLRDLSGGAGGLSQVEIIGTYSQPANLGINSIAVANANVAVTVGEVEASFAFIGKVQ